MENITRIETLELDEFAAKYLPALEARDAVQPMPTKYFSVGFENDGIYSVNIITANVGDNSLAAVTETAERYARRYGYKVAYVEEKPDWYVNGCREKGMPIYPIDDEAQRKYGASVNGTQDDAKTEQATPDDYFVANKETGKLELHFAKETYQALDDDAKGRIKSNFLWGRRSGCWISRCKEPNLHYAKRVAQELGLFDAGKMGERLSFAEQMERKAERAERRADRYEARSDAAGKRGEALQKPINDMRGDTAFFTQPNINTSAGRAFTRRREKMFAAFDRGFEEFRKSAYWQSRAKTARATASQKELQDKAFVGRRIAERESDIRKLKNLVTLYEGYVTAYENGETPKDKYGGTITMSAERCAEQLDYYLDRLEVKLDELGFYQDCLADLGGVAYSQQNIKPGYIVQVQRWGRCQVVSTGPKNCVVRFQSGNDMTFTPSIAYAEIEQVIKAQETQDELQPFKVGEQFTVTRWNGVKGNSEEVTYTIIRASDKSVTLKTGDEKPIVRKPTKVAWSREIKWVLRLSDWQGGIIYRNAAEQNE